jgi:hypothetical protein
MKPEPQPTWVCRGWTENYAPDDSPHQWMHAPYRVPPGTECDLCGASEDDPRRWDGLSDPFASDESRAYWGWAA